MPSAAENRPGETPPQFGFELGAEGEQQPGWWNVKPDVRQILNIPVGEVLATTILANHIRRTGAVTLLHVLSFGREIRSWDYARGFSNPDGKRMQDIAKHVELQSPFAWLQEPTVEDVARMCPTLADVWAGCLVGPRQPTSNRSASISQKRYAQPRDFTTHDDWVSVAEIAADSDFLSVFWEHSAADEALYECKAQAQDYYVRARAFKAEFEAAQQRLGVPEAT